MSTMRASAERPFLKEVFHTHTLAHAHTESHILSRSVSAATESRIEEKPEGIEEIGNNVITDLGDISDWDSFLLRQHQQTSICVLCHH